MSDQTYLRRAIELADQSPEPIGCGVVIVIDGVVVAEAFNSQHSDNLAVNHAEIKAVTAANRHLQNRKLLGATAYCSCEPCTMCLTALSYAKVGRIVFYRRMVDVFPGDPQSQLDAYQFVEGLNFVPRLEQLALE